MLKKFNWLLLNNAPKTTTPNKEKWYNKVLGIYANFCDLYEMIVNMDSHLAKAVEIKEQLYDFYSQCKYADARRELEYLMITCHTCEITAMQSFTKTLINWKNEIINSFIIIPDINKKMNNVLI